MLKIENDKYYRICDWCNNIREIKKGTYKSNLKKEIHLCVSCNQKRATEASKQKPVWNKGLTKETDLRVKKYCETQSKNKKGNVIPWNKGLTKETDLRVKKYSKTLSIFRKGYFQTEKYFIDKYGYDIGKNEYAKLNSKKAITVDNFILKYGKDNGIEKFKRYKERIHKKENFFSKISQELFWGIYNNLKNNEHIYFAKLNKEFGKLSNNNKYYFYDFVDTLNKKVIEFNGDVFHANPKRYKKDDIVNPFNKKTANEIWKYDNEKIDFIKSLGFDVLIIWESDYYNNKELILKKCIKFLEG